MIEFFLVARDQAALHAEIADRAGELGLGRFQVLLGRADIGLRAGQVRAHLPDLRIGVLLHLADLRREFIVGIFLGLANVLRESARLRQFGLREAELLRGHFQLAFEVRDARIGLIDLHGKDRLFRVGLREVGLQLGFLGIAGVEQIADQHESHDKHDDDPARRRRRFVEIGFVAARFGNIRGNTHHLSLAAILGLATPFR